MSVMCGWCRVLALLTLTLVKTHSGCCGPSVATTDRQTSDTCVVTLRLVRCHAALQIRTYQQGLNNHRDAVIPT